MKKRISRHELKEKIYNLRIDLEIEKKKREDIESKYKDIEKRFQEMGSQIETLNVQGDGIKCIEVEPQPWGTYAMLAPWSDESQEAMESLKKHLVSDIVKGLINANYVQFIYHDDILPGNKTFAAKLYVVPWDRLVSRRIKINVGGQYELGQGDKV